MRAVPDDFDNVQALHSPYGAVHGLGTPMGSPVGFGPGGYPDHMMRSSLVVDVRRAEGGDAMSSTGLSPAFNGIGFTSAASMSNPDLMASPMPHESGDRYDYSGQLTPMSGGPRTSNPFTRQSSLDGSSIPMHSQHARQPVRPLQPLQLRETLNRSRSGGLDSPLRSSMSWKGDAIDYTSYQAGGGSNSPQPLSGRAASVYHPQEPTSLGGYESSSYASKYFAISTTYAGLIWLTRTPRLSSNIAHPHGLSQLPIQLLPQLATKPLAPSRRLGDPPPRPRPKRPALLVRRLAAARRALRDLAHAPPQPPQPAPPRRDVGALHEQLPHGATDCAERLPPAHPRLRPAAPQQQRRR